jgi:hypothetical protein
VPRHAAITAVAETAVRLLPTGPNQSRRRPTQRNGKF